MWLKKKYISATFSTMLPCSATKRQIVLPGMRGSGAYRTYQVNFPLHHALLPPLDVYFMPEMKCLSSGGTFPSHHQVTNSKIAQLP